MNNQIVLDVIEENGEYKVILPEARIDHGNDQTKAPLPREETQNFEWAPWGEDDCLPTQIRQKLEKVPMASAAIYKQVAMMYGNGLQYYKNSDLKDGESKIQRAHIPAIENWMKANRLQLRWLIPQFVDYRYYMQTFSEVILNKRGDQITNLCHKPAEFCRLSKQNERSLDIERVIYSPDFATGFQPPPERRKSGPLFVWYDEDRFLNCLRGSKFFYHSRFETPGITYYARPFWLGLFRKGGWIDVSISVPEIVNSMMSNQVRLKYQIIIPESYFEIRHRDWQTYTDEKRIEAIDSKIDEINQALAGTENAYKSISVVTRQDIQGNELGKIEIIAIDDKIKEGSWVPSSEKADAQIVQGLGLHPSQVGLAPEGGKMGAGSGSDQRESFNTHISLNTIDQEVVLEPLNWIAQFNARTNPEWDVTFFIDHTHHTTTNEQESGMKPGDTTLQVEE